MSKRKNFAISEQTKKNVDEKDEIRERVTSNKHWYKFRWKKNFIDDVNYWRT